MGDLIKVGERLPSIISTFGKSEDGLKTGIRDLDEKTRGLKKGEFIILAGRPSMGKSALLVDAALEMSIEKNVMIVSLEMSTDSLIERMVSNLAKVSLHKIKSNRATERDWIKINNAFAELNRLNLWVDEFSYTPLAVSQKVEQLESKEGIDCVMIDYIQLMNMHEGSENRQQEITALSRFLKVQIAKRYNIPVLAACQLNRSVDYRESHRPRLSDLRESGSLEQDADVVMLLYNDAYYAKRSGVEVDDNSEAKIIVAKNRNGPTGDVNCFWTSEYMTFKNVFEEEF